MPNQLANNIVLACETQNPEGLCEGVFEALSMKAVSFLTREKQSIASTMLEDIDQPEASCRDPYDLYREPVREAIDKVVEAISEAMVSEKSWDLHELIKDSVEGKKNVSEDEVLEYFSDLGTTAVKTISTKETGTKHDNADRMGDEDETKVVQFESVVAELKKYRANTKPVLAMVENLYENLNPENRTKMVKTLTESQDGFISILELAQKVTNGN